MSAKVPFTFPSRTCYSHGGELLSAAQLATALEEGLGTLIDKMVESAPGPPVEHRVRLIVYDFLLEHREQIAFYLMAKRDVGDEPSDDEEVYVLQPKKPKPLPRNVKN